MKYLETDCVFRHQGRSFESGGAYVTDDRIIAYLGKDGILSDWHGKPLGTYRTVSTWPIYSFLSSSMSQVEAVVDGIRYTGRSLGEGMLYRGKRKRAT